MLSKLPSRLFLALVATTVITLQAGLTQAFPLPAPQDEGGEGAVSSTSNSDCHEGRNCDRYVDVDLVSRNGEHSPRKAYYGVCYKLDSSVWDDTSYLAVNTRDMVCSIYTNDVCSRDKSLVRGSKHVDVPRVSPGPVAFKCWPSKTARVD